MLPAAGPPKPPGSAQRRPDGNGGGWRFNWDGAAAGLSCGHSDCWPRGNSQLRLGGLHMLDGDHGVRRALQRASRSGFVRLVCRSLSQPMGWICLARRVLDCHFSIDRSQPRGLRNLYALLVPDSPGCSVGRIVFGCAYRDQSPQRPRLRTIRILVRDGQIGSHGDVRGYWRSAVVRWPRLGTIYGAGRIFSQWRFSARTGDDVRALYLRRNRNGGYYNRGITRREGNPSRG